MPSFEINIKTKDDPRGIQNATEETNKLTDAMGKLLDRAKRKEEYAAAKEAIAGMTTEEKEAALSAYQMAAANETAKSGLTNLERAVAGTRSTIGGLNSDLTVFGKNVGTSADLLSGLGVSIPISPMMALGTGIKAVSGFVKESIGSYTAYVAEVDKISTYTGMASEETSRLIQVADDLRIETSTVEMALKSMAEKGTTPSIQGLGQLSDRYIAIQDPLIQAQFLTDNFGRSGIEMARIMELGSEKIKDLSDGVSEYMVITGKSQEEAEAYIANTAELKDQWAAFGYQLGAAFIPPATAALENIVKTNAAIEEGGLGYMRLTNYLGITAGKFGSFDKVMEDATAKITAQTGEVNKQTAALAAANAELEKYGRRQREIITGGQRGNLSDTHGSIYDPEYVPYTGGAGRANGGPVQAGHMYTINENRPWTGPEYFVAPTDGMVIPGSGARGAGGRGSSTPIVIEYKPLFSFADKNRAVDELMPLVSEVLHRVGLPSHG